MRNGAAEAPAAGGHCDEAVVAGAGECAGRRRERGHRHYRAHRAEVRALHRDNYERNKGGGSRVSATVSATD